ncbi:2-oxoglutarate dehydrogenase, E2 component, dihydrolipoamide succinyltransferase [Dietzia sp. PP-33]|jgi:pyruvate dehydrogenase E2 component (dihydrolipoamide acetyltransferase)|uniref:2-oxoglutarate dehydrogenase, E2 component, dihydrolipoamide succinyltransferase n=1 Tax=Dietzia sp. PP-33 TaxID=2957500 RepID=UPI0029BDEEF8|nr:2-oxoglutarate dehydrogenase, E2 component, dihydrolipoamide succinyltransferase [Dietzia sp. PP-33]MDX2357421.1 2-oxoglutarate dehydrogenase, E2 component, dihydrolipoamide succinyltransferase [Dietzia sp. PP-33]
MAFSVQMPALGESVSEGTVTRWLKKEGDTVEVDEPLLEVSTDKVDTEIPSPAAGTLSKIVADEDETVEIGGELAIIDDGSGGSGDSEQDDSEQDDSGQDDEGADDSGADDSADEADEAPAEKPAPKKSSGGSGGKGTEITMPELGESVTEGTITNWLKAVGDTVEMDEPLLEVSTDKVDTEIPSPVAGTLQKIVADEDETVEVGAVLAVIGDGEGSDDDAPEQDDSAQDDSEQDDSGQDDEGADDSGADDSADEADEADEAPAEKPAPKKSSGGSGGKGTEVTMPELGESVTEGTITNWLKAVGDAVEMDEPLLEVSTDKVDTEIPSPVAGTLQKIVADEDETVEVGAVLAVIGDGSDDSDESDEPEDEGTPESAESARPEDAPKQAEGDATDTSGAKKQGDKAGDTPKQEKKAAEKAASKAETSEESTSDDRDDSDGVQKRAEPAAAAKSGTSPYVTPLVRKLAQENGVDLDAVKGTGIGGRIRKQDVLAAAEGSGSGGDSAGDADAPTEEKAPTGGPSSAGVRPELAELRGTTKKANRIRKITAKKTRESLQTSAQLTQVFEVDMTRVAQLRGRVKDQFVDKHGVKLTYLPFYAKAVVEALVSHPNVNASYDEDTNEITYHGSVNLGIAVDTEAGLLSPVIQNAQDLDIPGLSKAILDLAERARASKLTPDDLQGGTFTITNIGSEGALFDTPILVPPQAAMLGTGAIVRRPVVDADADGESIAIRSMGFMPLTYDHRLIDGADAGRFLTTVKDRLEKAEFEGDLGL